MNYKHTLVIVGLFCCTAVPAQPVAPYNNNIVSISPFVATEAGIGSGASWEHFFPSMGWLSFILPVMVAESTNGSGGGGMFYFTPGIKIYTDMYSYRQVKFSIGPSLVMGIGNAANPNTNYMYSGIPSLVETHFVYGAMINGALNAFITPRLYLGANLGLGFTSVNRYGGVNADVTGLDQFSFNIGYRFSSKGTKKSPK